MSMTRNLILAFILIFIFLFIYQLFVFPPPQEPTPQKDTTAVVEKQRNEYPDVDTIVGEQLLDTEPSKFTDSRIDSLYVITPYVQMVLNKHSGDILTYILPQYKFNGEPVNLIPDNTIWGVLTTKGTLLWEPQDYPDTIFLEGSVRDSLVFKGVLNDSIHITKVLGFDGKPYVMTVRIRGIDSGYVGDSDNITCTVTVWMDT